MLYYPKSLDEAIRKVTESAVAAFVEPELNILGFTNMRVCNQIRVTPSEPQIDYQNKMRVWSLGIKLYPIVLWHRPDRAFTEKEVDKNRSYLNHAREEFETQLMRGLGLSVTEYFEKHRDPENGQFESFIVFTTSFQLRIK